ncbi:MAG: hypothetical protein V4447_16365 [Pseudomonadota bacterium]
MIAYEIEIDGERYVTAGVEDWSILSLHVTASRAAEKLKVRDGYVECSVGGMTIPDSDDVRHHFRWVEAPLAIGSRVCIKVVEVVDADPPKNRYRSDSKIQENPFTKEEIREMRYRDYLELKAEFEGEARG